MTLATLIAAFAFCVHLYRYRGQWVAPDSRFYLVMGEGGSVPLPYSRRWLLPRMLGGRRTVTNMAPPMSWRIVSGVAWVAMGPLTYALTDSLACVWFIVWLPGLATNVRFPVLTDQVAFTLTLLAVVLFREGYLVAAMGVLFMAGQAKEVAPLFGVALCMGAPWMALAGGASFALAMLVGKRSAAPATEEYQRHPFKVALTKHDPLGWSMVLPWGGLAIVACAAWPVSSSMAVLCGVSLAMAYGQLLLANDEARLFVWAAPALLMGVAGYEGAWLVPALVAHPFLCGLAKRV